MRVGAKAGLEGELEGWGGVGGSRTAAPSWFVPLIRPRSARITRAYNRLLAPGLAIIAGPDPPQPSPHRAALRQVEIAINNLWLDAA